MNNTKTESARGPLSKQVIPDLWEISYLPELKDYTLGGREAGDLILETWHLAHDLQKSHTELLEACKVELEALEVWIRGANIPDDVFDGMQISRDKIKAAIAKAEGRQ